MAQDPLKSFVSASAPNAESLPPVKDIFSFTAESLGQLRTWLEQNPPAIPITQIVGFDLNAAVPPGAIFQFGGTAAPANYLLCDGSAVSRTQYSNLFSTLGTSYGTGDGSTTFNLPDLRGRVPVGYAASGGHSDVATLGNNDGTALANRRPKHQHTVYDPGHVHGIQANASHIDNNGAFQRGDPNFGTQTWENSATTGVKVNPEGASSSSSPSNTPAYVVVNYIIKT